MADMEKQLRELQRQIAATNLENAALKALMGGEQELRDDRAQEETAALWAVADDVKQSTAFAEEEKRKSRKQKEFAESHSQAFTKATSDATQRVTDLLQ